MRDYTTLTKEEKTGINKFFEEKAEKYNEESFRHLKDIDTLFFVYDKANYEFISFGIDLNEAIHNALKWNEKKIDVNYLLEYLNEEFEFIVVSLQYKPRLY